MNVNISLNKD